MKRERISLCRKYSLMNIYLNTAGKFLHVHLVSASFHDVLLTLLVSLLPLGLGASFSRWFCSQWVVSTQNPLPGGIQSSLWSFPLSACWILLGSLLTCFYSQALFLWSAALSWGHFPRWIYLCWVLLPSLLAYPKKQSSPAPGLHFFSCGAFSVQSVFHIPSSQISAPPHWTLCLPHPAWPHLPELVKPWWHHRKINRIKANWSESPKELEKFLSQPNQLRKGFSRSRKVQTEQVLTFCRLRAKFMATAMQNYRSV